MFHPLYKAGQFNIEEAGYHPISCEFVYNSKPGGLFENIEPVQNDNNQKCILFNQGCSIPCAKSVEFNKSSPCIEVKLKYEPVIAGFNDLLMELTIFPKKEDTHDFKNKARIVFNENGILEVDKVEQIEEFKIEPLMPV
jgi:heat shock protein 4